MGALPQVQGFRIADDRNHKPVGGLYGDTDMHRLKLPDDLALIVKVRITLGKFFHNLHQGLHEERQVGEFGLAFLPQSLQFGDIDLLNIAEMRDAAGAQAHLFGYLAAQPRQFDFAHASRVRFGFSLRLFPGLIREGIGLTGDRIKFCPFFDLFDIGAGNAPVRPGAGYPVKVNAPLPGKAADGGRCLRPGTFFCVASFPVMPDLVRHPVRYCVALRATPCFTGFPHSRE